MDAKYLTGNHAHSATLDVKGNIALTRTCHWPPYYIWHPVKGASKEPQQIGCKR